MGKINKGQGFVDRIISTSFNSTTGILPLTKFGLIDHRLPSEIKENILLRYIKNGKVGLCDRNGKIIVEPFADKIDVDGVFVMGNNQGIINLYTGDILCNFENVEIYQPNINNGQLEYILKDGDNMSVLDFGEYSSHMVELLKLKIK